MLGVLFQGAKQKTPISRNSLVREGIFAKVHLVHQRIASTYNGLSPTQDTSLDPELDGLPYEVNLNLIASRGNDLRRVETGLKS